MRTGEIHSECWCNAWGQGQGVWPRRVQNPFCTNKVMLHVKSKVEYSGANILLRGHAWGHQRSKSRILGHFYYQTTPRLLGNSPVDEDWRNAFGILMCAEICDGTGAGARICDSAPSTCSNYRLYSARQAWAEGGVSLGSTMFATHPAIVDTTSGVNRHYSNFRKKVK